MDVWPAIVWAGLACGVLDISAALIVYPLFGIPRLRILQGVAAGLLGRRAFDGGLKTALLGLGCHFFNACSWAVLYTGLSRLVPLLNEHAILSGIIYACVVYGVMNHIVVPLSAIGKRPFSVKMTIIGVIIHIFCVGLPIAIVVRRFS
jgi:hypothetical protein